MGAPIKCDCGLDARDHAIRRRYRGPRGTAGVPCNRSQIVLNSSSVPLFKSAPAVRNYQAT
jgi:hypothetical protein